MQKADLIVIGAGPGGFETAAAEAAKGRDVVIIERALAGGTCLNRGCIPTKCLYDDGADCQKATTAFFQFLIDVVAKGDWILDPTISSSDAWVSFAAQDVLLMDGYVSGANSIVSLVADSGNPFPWTYEVSPVVEAGKPNKGQSPGGGALFIAKTGDPWRHQRAGDLLQYLLNDNDV